MATLFLNRAARDKHLAGVHAHVANGAAGILSRTLDGRLFSLMSFTVARGRIVEIDVLASPARLRRLGLAV